MSISCFGVIDSVVISGGLFYVFTTLKRASFATKDMNKRKERDPGKREERTITFVLDV